VTDYFVAAPVKAKDGARHEGGRPGTGWRNPEVVTIRSPIPGRGRKRGFIISKVRFPADRVRTRPLLSVLSATVLAGACVTFGTATAAADDLPPPPLHQIHYTVWAEEPFTAEIYYRDTDPPNWAEYSHNPYLYSPNIEAEVGPNQQWNLDVGLADPDQWAMVVAGTGGESPKRPNIHCALAVDGVVVKTAQGPKGALCSIRAW